MKNNHQQQQLHTLPWQYDLQLNLETWKQISKNGDIEKIIN